MTEARRLKPRPHPSPRPRSTPQCEQPVEEMSYTADSPPGWREQRYRRQGLDPRYCTKQQVAIINGKGYCSFHAGQHALAILLGEE